MSHLPFTVSAYFFNAISVLVDKFLLAKTIADPLVYVFYFSIFSLVALILLPFVNQPSLTTLVLASASTVLWTTGAYFMFTALKRGQASGVIPVIGTLIPIYLLIFSLYTKTITPSELWAIVFLLLGLIYLTLPDWLKYPQGKLVYLEALSALLFAVSYLVLRQAYLQENFLTVFAYSRLILLPVGALILLLPTLRQKVFIKSSGPKFKLLSKMGLLFLLGQMAGGSSELLLTFSISLAKPALVNSLQGVQYVFLFIFSLILSRFFPRVYKEEFSPSIIFVKLFGILMVGVGLYILAFNR